jgi:hypothetical protein
MSYDDFLAELGKAGLSVRGFAELLGMRPNSISNNKKQGEVPGHLAVIAALLAEMRFRDMDYEPVFARVSLSKKKSRGAAGPGKFAGDKQGILELGS